LELEVKMFEAGFDLVNFFQNMC